ncbi:hypothetical protein BgiMline_025547 [Biomphalaria glabrata]|nr:C7orf31 [Biomphalaria glabrata]
MTSLELVRHPDTPREAPNDWGTGRRGAESLWIPRAPTFHHTGFPLEHHYQLTSLKLSAVRDNDELIPRPQSVNVIEKAINKPFPAEHPFASHIEKFALIPKFDSPQDPKRGVAARRKPISNEMPANPYDTIVVKKTKGFPYREEIQFLPSDTNKDPLYWQGEHFFDQQSKIHGNRLQYYPTPIKQIAPNLQERPPEYQVSERSENVLRNLERDQWLTTHNLNYTGLGPANPMCLDNLECKNVSFFKTGLWDDNLYPCSVNTFDPARPMEGRLRKLFAPKHPEQIYIESGFTSTPVKRKKNKNEIEEDRLLNGRDYVNLPEDFNKNNLNEIVSCPQQPGFANVDTSEPQQETGRTGEATQRDEVVYLSELEKEMQKSVQQIEAQNRWKLLESSTPKHDITQLRVKYNILKDKEMPTAFYRHEGKYNEERAGLYKTSYDPQQLAYSMNAQRLSGGTLFNTSLSHVDASQYPTVLWDENEAALRDSNTVVFKNNELSGDRPSTGDMLDPYNETVALQRAALQPDVATANPRVQEGEFILRDSVYGGYHNTKKFLQENKLEKNIRIDPSFVMSKENQNLERVREKAAPRNKPVRTGSLKVVNFSDTVNVGNMHVNVPVKIEESFITPLTKQEGEELASAFGHDKITSLSYTETKKQGPQSINDLKGDCRNLAENLLGSPAVPTVIARNTTMALKPEFVNFTRKPQRNATSVSEMADQFRSLSTNFLPTGLKNASSMSTSYSSQFPYYDLSEKKDRRFDWEPGKGHLKPQSCLMDLQDSFIKSEVHKRFHHQFPEIAPDHRINVNSDIHHRKRTILSNPSLAFEQIWQAEEC